VHEFLTFTITGLATAGIYAITASGLTLTYTTTGIFNWAHGATGMISAFFYWQLRFGWNLPAPLAIGLCLIVFAPAFGMLIEFGIMRRLDGASEARKLVATLALALGLLALAQWIWSPTTLRDFRPLFGDDVLVFGALRISYNDVTVLVVAVLVAVFLRIFMYRTRLGVSMRATVDDRSLMTLNGARPRSSAQAAWIIGSSLAAIAGILVAPTLTLSAVPLTLLIVSAYAAAVIGRLRSIPMTFVGALILGLAVSYGVGYLPENQYVQGFEGVIPVAVMFVALLALPQARLRGHRLLRRQETSVASSWRGTVLFGIGVVAGAAMLSVVVSNADLFSLTRVWGIAIVGLSLIPLTGYGGRLSLCQLSFAAIGAIVVAHSGAHGNPLSLVWAAVITGAAGALVALPALRLSGIYLALSTAAFAVAMDNWILPLPAFSILGHSFEMFPTGSLSVARFRLGPLNLANNQAFFIVGSVIFVLLVLAVVLIRRSVYGLGLLALNDSPAACGTLGMNSRFTTLSIFALSAAMAGIGGAFYSSALTTAAPDVFQFFSGLSIVLVMVVAGINSPGAALVCGLFLGGPTIGDIFPSLSQLSSVLVAGAGINLALNPNGFIPGAIRPMWEPLGRHPWRVAVTLGAILLLWGIRLGGLIDNWTLTIAVLLVVVLAPVTSGLYDRKQRTGRTDATSIARSGGWKGLSAAPELLGLTASFSPDDINRLDQLLGIPGADRAS
jgi:branched-chain amino acid transport system permease protein